MVSTHRGNDLLIASGDKALRPGDALTIFGDEAARKRIEERFRPRTDEELAPGGQQDVRGPERGGRVDAR